MNIHQLLLLLLSISFSSLIHGESVKDHMYSILSNNEISYCTRKLNSTNEIGCASNFNGNFGVLYLINTTSNIKDFIEKSKNDSNQNYILIIPSHIFINSAAVEDILSASNVQGLVVIDIEEPNQNPFSELTKCPNGKYSPNSPAYCSKDWNKYGSGYATKSWPFPVVLAYANARDLILKCHREFNANTDGRLCALEIMAQMNAVGDAKVCDRRNGLMGASIIRLQPMTFCQPLNVENLYVWLSNSENSSLTKDDKVTLIITRVDSRSMFPSASSGAQQIAISTSLLTSSTLRVFSSLVTNDTNNRNHVLIVFMDGESYDYVGSSILANSLQSADGLKLGSIQIQKEQIDSIWEIGHLGSLDKLFLQYSTSDGKFPDEYKDIFPNATLRNNTLFPPCSLLTFVRHGFKLPLFLLSDSEDVVDEPYFSSYLDRKVKFDEEILQNYVEKFIRLISLKLNVNNGSSEYEGFELELMNCFMNNASCDLFTMYMSAKNMNLLKALPGPIPTQNDAHFKIKLADLIFSIITTRTSEIFYNVTKYDDCNTMAKKDSNPAVTYYYQYFNDSVYCMRGPTFKQTYDDFFNLSQSNYASWMLSAVGSLQTRLFLIPSPGWEVSTLIVGLILTALTVIITLLVKRSLAKYVDYLAD